MKAMTTMSRLAPVSEIPGDEGSSSVVRRGRLQRVIREEFAGLHLRLLLIQLSLGLMPRNVGGRVRVLLLRAIGFSMGSGTIMAGTPHFTGGADLYRNLSIGSGCWFNFGCLFDLAGRIDIGNNVSFGHEVIVLTNSHQLGPHARRAATLCNRPVSIGDGAWLGARCTILPGVSIGAGAVVAAGAVVNKDVAADTIVAGVPARTVKSLEELKPV